MNKKFFTLLLLGAIPLLGLWAYMDLSDQAAKALLANGTNWIIIVLLVFLFIAVLQMFSYLNKLQELILLKSAKEAELAVEETTAQASWWSTFYARITDAVPVEDEKSIETDHNYDGIIELDNNLPPWWKAGFYLGIVFAVVYFTNYHILQRNPLSHDEYAQEMDAAQAEVEAYLATAKDLVDESNVVALMDEAALSKGAKLFGQNCAVCHAADGGGGVGPNLTDRYWLHGGGMKDVFTTVKYGVPTKGMIAWKDNLRPGEIQEVASYVLSLVGTTPAKPIDPQGDLYEEITEQDSPSGEDQLVTTIH